MKIILSSTNQLKIDACKLAFEKFFSNELIEIQGFKVESNVSDQPMSFEETYLGAKNRLQNLKVIIEEKKLKYDYLVSVEGGNEKIFLDSGMFGFEIALIMNEEGNISTGIDIGLIIPQKYLDQIPYKYADLGILFKTEFGIDEKDPYKVLSKGRISRESTLQNAIYKALIQSEVK